MVTLFGPTSVEGRILVELFMNDSFCNTHVVVGVKAQLTFPVIVREFDIFPAAAAPPDSAMIGFTGLVEKLWSVLEHDN